MPTSLEFRVIPERRLRTEASPGSEVLGCLKRLWSEPPGLLIKGLLERHAGLLLLPPLATKGVISITYTIGF